MRMALVLIEGTAEPHGRHPPFLPIRGPPGRLFPLCRILLTRGILLRHRDIRRPVTDFLWRTMHGALRVGSFWTKIPGHEDRAVCAHCDELESIDHILFHCKAEGQATVWRAAKDLWARKAKDSTIPKAYKWSTQLPCSTKAPKPRCEVSGEVSAINSLAPFARDRNAQYIPGQTLSSFIVENKHLVSILGDVFTGRARAKSAGGLADGVKKDVG